MTDTVAATPGTGAWQVNKADQAVLFRLLRDTVTLRADDLTVVMAGVRGDHKAERALARHIERLDWLHALLYELGATDVEPEDDVRRRIVREGLARREVPDWGIDDDEAGDDGAEE